jgi:hypothetical protein
VIGVGLAQHLQQHRRKAVDGIHRRAVRPRHRRQLVKGTKDETGAVDQIDVSRR